MDETKRLSEQLGRRRKWAMLLLLPGLVATAAGFLAIKDFVSLAGPYPYILVIVGLALIIPGLFCFGCPRCKTRIIPATAKVCPGCALPVGLNASAPQIPRSEDDVKGLQKDFEQRQELFECWQRRRNGVSAVLGLVIGVLAAAAHSGFSPDLDWTLLILVAVVSGGICRSFFHNILLLIFWRCPACRAMLPLYTEVRNCPNCSLEVVPGE